MHQGGPMHGANATPRRRSSQPDRWKVGDRPMRSALKSDVRGEVRCNRTLARQSPRRCGADPLREITPRADAGVNRAAKRPAGPRC